jgi:hypothetical protein
MLCLDRVVESRVDWNMITAGNENEKSLGEGGMTDGLGWSRRRTRDEFGGSDRAAPRYLLSQSTNSPPLRLLWKSNTPIPLLPLSLASIPLYLSCFRTPLIYHTKTRTDPLQLGVTLPILLYRLISKKHRSKILSNGLMFFILRTAALGMRAYMSKHAYGESTLSELVI